MNNIFNNSFYETPPQPTWAFKVHFDSEDLTELEKQTLSSAVSKIIIPERKNDPSLDVGFAGFIKSFRNRTSNSSSVTFEFNENQNMTVRSVLKKLQKNAISNDYYDTTSTYEKTSLDRFDIHLQMIDPENPDEKSNITNEFILTGCFIESIGGFNLDYENETEVIKYSVSINYTFGY